jgi:FkbM family methyltransferase
MSPSVQANAAWDVPNLEAFVARVRPDQDYTLIDIGANIGLFSRQVALRIPKISRILCIEPDINNFTALRYNLSVLEHPTSLFNIALGNGDTEAEFFRDSENFGNYSLIPDAMRDRPHDAVRVQVSDTAAWMKEHLSATGAILWKSDTQGPDDMIVAQTPWDIWERIEVALIEIWRIVKPEYDREALFERIDLFPNRQLGGHDVTASDVLEYLSGDDYMFQDLLLWK